VTSAISLGILTSILCHWLGLLPDPVNDRCRALVAYRTLANLMNTGGVGGAPSTTSGGRVYLDGRRLNDLRGLRGLLPVPVPMPMMPMGLFIMIVRYCR
jgi:hypothetical protein